MKARNDIPDSKLTSALEAVSNLLVPELNGIFSAAWTAALAANSEINIRPVNLRAGPFHSHLGPFLKELISVLAGTYRRYFRLALAHAGHIGQDPHDWAWAQLQPFVDVAIERIRDWYMLACDGSNRHMQPIASVPFQPGQTVSIPIPLNPPEIASPESWRAPAWLFAVGAVVGIGPLKDKNVPARDTEEKLDAAHTRLLLKGARRVFLWKLGAEIETAKNQEIAAAGSVLHNTTVAEPAKASTGRRRPKYQPKGTEGLGKKLQDYSKHMVGLTEKQQMAFTLRLEYRLPLTEVAARMSIDRKTAYEHFRAASKKIDEAQSNEKRKAKQAKSHSED